MLDITQLPISVSMPALADASRFSPDREDDDPLVASAGADVKPMVTWRVTRFCNLNCINCTSDSRPHRSGAELSTAEGMDLIRDLAEFQVSQLLFAGGEPLLRGD